MLLLSVAGCCLLFAFDEVLLEEDKEDATAGDDVLEKGTEEGERDETLKIEDVTDDEETCGDVDNGRTKLSSKPSLTALTISR